LLASERPVPAVYAATLGNTVHAGTPLVIVSTSPLVPAASAPIVFALDAYNSEFAGIVDIPIPPCPTESGVVSPASDRILVFAPDVAYGLTVQFVAPGVQPGATVSPGAYGELGGVANATLTEAIIIKLATIAKTLLARGNPVFIYFVKIILLKNIRATRPHLWRKCSRK
jgi:hypothetical protein